MISATLSSSATSAATVRAEQATAGAITGGAITAAALDAASAATPSERNVGLTLMATAGSERMTPYCLQHLSVYMMKT
jgi:hypothetical protein